MEELKSDYHDANSFPLNDLDQTTSTTHLSQEKKQRTSLKPVVQHYLKQKNKEIPGTIRHNKENTRYQHYWHNIANMKHNSIGTKDHGENSRKSILKVVRKF